MNALKIRWFWFTHKLIDSILYNNNLLLKLKANEARRCFAIMLRKLCRAAHLAMWRWLDSRKEWAKLPFSYFVNVFIWWSSAVHLGKGKNHRRPNLPVSLHRAPISSIGQVVIPRYVPSHFDGCLLSSPAKNCVVIIEAVICEGPKLAPLPGIRETHASMVTFLVMVMLSMVCGWISQCSALVLSMYLH